MSSRLYDNFDVLIEGADAGQFRVRVTHSAVGDTPVLLSSLPFSDVELENALLKLDPGRSGTRRMADPYTQASQDLGSGLFDAVFRDDVREAWSRSVDNARERDRGVRLRLRLAEVPALAGLPWEFLYDRRERRFVAQSDRTPIVRYLDVRNPPRPLIVGGPLHILVVISSPNDLERLDVEHEWASICHALAETERSGLVVVDRLRYASLIELQRWLRQHPVHVLHFVGHGDFDPRTRDGVLALCDPNGRAVNVSSAQLGAHVRDHDPLRLVVLNACRTATTDSLDAYSGMAQGLVQQEAAAVVAMQFPITDGAAIVFTNEFYGALADGEPVDQAVTSARKAMLSDFSQEWATPVLFLRASDGRIFDRIERRSEDRITPPPQPPLHPLPEEAQPPRKPPGRPPDSPPPAGPPPAGPPIAAREPPERSSRPHRARWIAILLAIILLIGGGIAWGVITSDERAASHPTTRPSLTSASPAPTQSLPHATGNTSASRPASPNYPLVGDVRAYTGPSAYAYGSGQVVAGTVRVNVICDLYGQVVGTNQLWHFTDHGWINDHDVRTGKSDPVRNACTGNVNRPTEGSLRPSAATGPFGTLGLKTIYVRSLPGNSAAPVDALTGDQLITVTCHASTDYVEAPTGGYSSTDWDQIGPGRWIPDADLLTGKPGSPAPTCASAGGPPSNPNPYPNPSPSPSPSPDPTIPSSSPGSPTPSASASKSAG